MSLSQADADRASQRFPGTTLADLNEGKAQFEKKCSKCHSLNKPFAVPEKVLTKVMPQMADKAHIDDRTKDQVYAYIITVRTAGKRK